ncbi:hypothetical protein FPV67DRAFT_1420008 [Lyophyllum atratum]|nr:hypothetical protein FPV67DRAFT_1420008 [Lyophyllum atratum]
MFPQIRQLCKQALWWTRIKVVYMRITLSRFTTLYFFFALLNCVVLVILQGLAYADNSEAVRVIRALLSDANVTQGLPILSNGVLQMCDSLPGQPGTTCTTLWNWILKEDHNLKSHAAVAPAPKDDSSPDHESDDEGGDHSDDEEDEDVPGKNDGSPTSPARSGIQEVPCAQTMMWLEDVLEDEKREDVVTLFFNFWLFSLAVVTILNESLPHLGASLAGHVLGTAWAAFRVSSTEKLRRNYENLVVNGACQTDFMGDWWSLRRVHTIPILVVNAVALSTIAYLSLMLFKIYASQSFGRVGASAQVNRIYKIVLVFSACLQLTAFFSLASTAMWLDHICSGIIHDVVRHGKLYLAAFIITLCLLLPWLGWVSVRKEGRKRFWVFSVISVFLVGVSTMMFTSAIYRFIFMSWPFFATITVTSFVLILVTTLLGVWCRLNFGRGLAHFLQVSDVLEGADFTPVYFSKDAEKRNTFNVNLNDNTRYLDEKYPSDMTKGYIQQPEVSYSSNSKAPRGQSVYSENSGMPVKLSSTPSLFQERDRAAARAASTRRSKAFGGDHLNLGRDGYSQPQMPPRSATPSTRTRASHRSRDLTSSPRSSVTSATPDPSPTSTRSATPPALASRPGLPANPKIRPDHV